MILVAGTVKSRSILNVSNGFPYIASIVGLCLRGFVGFVENRTSKLTGKVK
jgi:hypothetical protein